MAISGKTGGGARDFYPQHLHQKAESERGTLSFFNLCH